MLLSKRHGISLHKFFTASGKARHKLRHKLLENYFFYSLSWGALVRIFSASNRGALFLVELGYKSNLMSAESERKKKKSKSKSKSRRSESR